MPKNKKINYEMGDNIHDNVTLNRINWFPGHMNKAIKKIKERLKAVDIVLEIRDARSPLVTSNKVVINELGQKSRLIVINKTNLADPNVIKLWKEWFFKQGIPFIFTNSFDIGELKKVVQLSKDIVHKKRLQSNPEGVTKTSMKMMILGLPNTGKSTIINRLANRNASKVADRPGQTQQQIWVKIDMDLEVLDTPGIMPPKIDKYEHGQWLSALHAIPDTVVEAEVPACYIIEYLLNKKSPEFKECYKLQTFDLSLIETLDHIAKYRGCIRHKGAYDYERVYNIILGDFRSGNLGLISFGLPPS